MTYKNYNYFNLTKIFLIFFFISIWGSIDTNFENVLNIYNDFKFTNVIKFLRSILPFVIFLIISIYFFKNSKILKRVKKKNFFDFTFYFFSMFILVQLIGHFVSYNKIIFTYYFFLPFFLLIYLYYAAYYNLLDNSFYISLFFLVILFLFFGFLSYKHFFTNGDLHLYGTFPTVYKSILTVSTNVIRSSGLSRIAMLIYIPFFIYLMLSPITKKKIFLNFLITFILLLTQSRITNIFWLIFLLLASWWCFNEIKIKVIAKKFTTYVIIPFLLTGALISIKYYLLASNIILVDARNDIVELNIFDNKNKNLNAKNGFGNDDTKIERNLFLDDNIEIRKIPLIRDVDSTTISSGRLEYWKQIKEKNNRKFIGNGFLGDRFLIQNNSSNILFYSYASGGFISVFLLLVIILRCFYICVDLMFIKKIQFNKKNLIVISSVFYLGFLTFRGIGENTYAVFSIDMIIFLQSLLIVEKSRKNFLKKKYEKR